jgi:hypothetical protein
MSQPDVSKIQEFLFERYGLELGKKQARRYRFVLGNPDKALESLLKKIDRSNSADGGAFLTISAGSNGEEEVLKATGAANSSTQVIKAMVNDFEEEVRKPLNKNHRKLAYNGLALWLDKWVSTKGMVALRGMLYHHSHDVYTDAGLLSEDSAGEEQMSSVIHQSSWSYERLKELMSGDLRHRYAKNWANGSVGCQVMAKELEAKNEVSNAEEGNFFFLLAEKMLADLHALEPASGKESAYDKALAAWIKHWVTSDGHLLLSNTLAQKRYLIKNKKAKVNIADEDREKLIAIKERNNLSSFAEAVSFVISSFEQLESSKGEN